MSDLTALARYAADACGLRFAKIAEGSDPADRPLQTLLKRMSFAADLAGMYLGEAELAPEGRTRVQRAIPSLSTRFGEGPLGRDAALFLAESVKEETGRFYATLAREARGQTRALLELLAEREGEELQYLREVVLQD